MNMPELLGAGSAIGPAMTAKGGPEEQSREGGDAFKSSVQSLSTDSENAEGDLAQQSGNGNLATEETGETQAVSTETDNTEGRDLQANTSQQSVTAGPFTAIQSFLSSRTNTQGTTAAAQKVTSSDADYVGSKSLLPPETSPQGFKSESVKPELPVKLISPFPGAAETGDSTRQTNGIGKETPGFEKAPATSQISNVLTAQGQASQSSDLTVQTQTHLGDAAAKQNGAVLRTITDPSQPTKVADPSTGALQNSDANTVEPKAVTQPVRDRAAEEAAFENRLHERRSSESTADIKLSDRAAQTQQISNPSTPSVMRSGPLVLEFGQTTSSLQSTVAAGQTPVSREIIVERGAVLNVTPAGASDASSRNTIAQISAAMRNQPQVRTIELSLDPPELGRVEIQMDVAEVGLKATLSAERPGTSDLIRRQAEILLQQLNEAGFSDVDLDFRDFGSGKQSDRENQDDLNTGQQANFSGKHPDVLPEARSRVLANNNGMDVRL